MGIGELSVGPGAEIIVLAQSPISRVYYATGEPPVICWSEKGVKPEQYVSSASGEVPTKPQAGRCLDCSKSVKGSNGPISTACKFEQRLAVVLPDEYDIIYRLRLRPSSIFGKASNGIMPWKAYTQFLTGMGTEFDELVTYVQPCIAGNQSKFSFRPMSYLGEETLEQIRERLQDRISEALKFTVPPEAPNPFGQTEGFSFGDPE